MNSLQTFAFNIHAYIVNELENDFRIPLEDVGKWGECINFFRHNTYLCIGIPSMWAYEAPIEHKETVRDAWDSIGRKWNIQTHFYDIFIESRMYAIDDLLPIFLSTNDVDISIIPNLSTISMMACQIHLWEFDRRGDDIAFLLRLYGLHSPDGLIQRDEEIVCLDDFMNMFVENIPYTMT